MFKVPVELEAQLVCSFIFNVYLFTRESTSDIPSVEPICITSDGKNFFCVYFVGCVVFDLLSLKCSMNASSLLEFDAADNPFDNSLTSH